MSGFPFIILIFVAATGFAALAFYIAGRRTRTINLAWGDLSARLGMNLNPASFSFGPSVVGEQGGRPAQMYLQPSGWRRGYNTRLRLTIRNRSQLRMKISTSKRSLNFLSDFSRTNIVHTGNDAIDARFMIWGNPQPMTTKLISDTVIQSELLSLPGWVEIEINGPNLWLDRRGGEHDVELLLEAFKILDHIANLIEGM